MKEFDGKYFLLIVENNSVPLDFRVWQEARALRDAGARVSIICPVMREDHALFEEIDGIQIHRYRLSFSNGTVSGYLREYLGSFLKTVALLHRILFRNPRIHVVHVANPPDIFWPLALYLRLWGTKFIFDEHDLSPEGYLSRFGVDRVQVKKMYRILVLMERLSYRFSHAIISTNESYRMKAISADASYADKTFVVRNGPDTRYFLPTPPNPEYKKGRTFLAAYAGIIAAQDGVDNIIRAVDILVNVRKFTDFIVYIVGTGDAWEKMRAMSERLDLNDYIVFTGFKPRSVFPEILSTAEVCLSPDPPNPLNNVSTMNKVMEYMAVGKPTVSFDLKETRFSAGESAVYVTNNDAGAFADAIVYLFEHPDLREQMGKMGRKRIEDALCWQIQAKNLLQVYRFVLSRNGVNSKTTVSTERNEVSISYDPASQFIPKATPALNSMLKLQPDVPDLAAGDRPIEDFLYERYLTNDLGLPTKAYYSLKPIIPQAVGIALRRLYSRVQGRRRFPAWPIEPVLVNALDRYMKVLMETTGRTCLHRIAPWPAGVRAAFVITHDVEWDEGLRNVGVLAEMEKQYGFRSSWNIVPERYPLDWAVIDRLRSDGFEIGVHGFRHDGSLFRSRRDFDQYKGVVNRYIKEWGVVGFRSEALLRNADWMQELDAMYDSSFPDTDPYQPQEGGCCSIFPYFYGDLVELPITLPQDHTLFEILRLTDISIWKEKASWIEEKGGCILIDVHPDYMLTTERLSMYESFLSFMKEKSDIWNALPRDVAGWWNARNDSTLRRDGTGWVVEGPAAGRATIIKTSLENHTLLHQFVQKIGE